MSFNKNEAIFKFLTQLGFKTLFIYFILFITTDLLTRVISLLKINFIFFDSIVSWIGLHVLNIKYAFVFESKDLGDTTFNFVFLFCILIISVLGGFVWAIFYKSKNNQKTLYYFLTVVLRYYLVFILLNYGLVKLFYLQFPEPSLHRLVQTYGNSSPMGLAWTFLGFSKGYNIFMGLSELMCLFLLFRRTQTFGLIITLAVTLNVFLINIFYDIPLKIITAHLVICTLFLLFHDLKKLYAFFFKNDKTSLSLIDSPRFLKFGKVKSMIYTFKVMFVISILILAFFKLKNRQEVLHGTFKKSQFYGIYDVMSYKVNGKFISLESKLENRWKYLIMQYKGQCEFIDSKDESSFFNVSLDSINSSIQFFRIDNSSNFTEFKYKKLDKKNLVFNGLIQGDSVEIIFRVLKEPDFLLLNRGFNLINEKPFNR